MEIEDAQLEGRVIEAISTIFDPEIPVNIYELGLIYNIGLSKPGSIRVEMTLTSPSCPVAGTLPGECSTCSRKRGWSRQRRSEIGLGSSLDPRKND